LFGEYYSTNFPNDYNLIDPHVLNYNVKHDVEFVEAEDVIGSTGYVHEGYLPTYGVADVSLAGLLVQEETSTVPNFVSYRFNDKSYLNRRTDLFKGL
jgi:hypothetical protein